MSRCRLRKFHWPAVELIQKSKHLTLAYTAWYSLAPVCLGSILSYDSSPWPQDASLLGLSVRASLAHEGAFLPGAVLPSSGFSVLSEGRGEFLGVTSLRCPRGAVPSSAGSSGSLCLGRVPPLDPPWSQPALRPQPEGPHQHGRPFGKLRWINCTGLRCCF